MQAADLILLYIGLLRVSRRHVSNRSHRISPRHDFQQQCGTPQCFPTERGKPKGKGGFFHSGTSASRHLLPWILPGCHAIAKGEAVVCGSLCAHAAEVGPLDHHRTNA